MNFHMSELSHEHQVLELHQNKRCPGDQAIMTVGANNFGSCGPAGFLTWTWMP
jgi:hypothetical protein